MANTANTWLVEDGVSFGWVTQPTPRPAMEPADMREYNRLGIRMLPPEFTTVWFEDHFQWRDEPTLECFTTMTYLAAEFPDRDIGSLVLGQNYRNPALLAKMSATLQYLSSGRLVLGVGAGWKEDEYRAYGYAYPSPGERVAQLDETVQILRAMWGESPATFHGAHYSITDAYCEPRPNPPIPLLIGGSGERGTLKVVARYADAWNFGFGSVEAMRQKLDVLRQHCATVGRDPGEIALTYYGIVDFTGQPDTSRRPDMLVFGPTPADAVAGLRPYIELGVKHIMLRTADLNTLERFCAEALPQLTRR